MAIPEADAALSERLMRLYFRYIAPIATALKKHRRLRRLETEFGALPCASIDLADHHAGCLPSCVKMIQQQRTYLAGYFFRGHDTAGLRRLPLATPFLLDLAAYRDFDAYAELLKAKPGITRDVKKARKLGYRCAPYVRAEHFQAIFEIEASKHFRSGAPVLAAFFGKRPRHRPPPPPPADACPLHWQCDWGVFAPAPEGSPEKGDGRLVGMISLRRIGDMARLVAMIGHGAHLSNGIVKLLFAEVMRWLLERDDPRVVGLGYLHAGAVEHGNDGLVTWKQRFGFMPYVFDEAARPSSISDTASGVGHRNS